MIAQDWNLLNRLPSDCHFVNLFPCIQSDINQHLVIPRPAGVNLLSCRTEY